MLRLWSVLLFLPAVVLAQLSKTTPIPMPGMNHPATKMIKGNETPALIPDITAYRLFFLAAAVDPNPTANDQKRQLALLAKASLTNLDAQAVVTVLNNHRHSYKAMIAKFNAEETAREKLGQASQTAAFLDQRDQLVQQTHDLLTHTLSQDGMTKLEALIQAEKSGMQISSPSQGAQ